MGVTYGKIKGLKHAIQKTKEGFCMAVNEQWKTVRTTYAAWKTIQYKVGWKTAKEATPYG